MIGKVIATSCFGCGEELWAADCAIGLCGSCAKRERYELGLDDEADDEDLDDEEQCR